MILSNETLLILKNFTSINTSLYFKKGDKLTTISPQKNILAQVNIKEEFPQDFAIYDLNNFLSVISLFKENAELDFDAKHVIIKGLSGRSKIKYRVTEPSLILDERSKKIIDGNEYPNVDEDVSFNLTESDLNWVMKTSNVLSCPNVIVESDGNQVNLITCDISNDSAHTNSILLNNIKYNEKFRLIFKTENLKLLSGNYSIIISKKGISKFIEYDKQLTYWITLEKGSVYE